MSKMLAQLEQVGLSKIAMYHLCTCPQPKLDLYILEIEPSKRSETQDTNPATSCHCLYRNAKTIAQ